MPVPHYYNPRRILETETMLYTARLEPEVSMDMRSGRCTPTLNGQHATHAKQRLKMAAMRRCYARARAVTRWKLRDHVLRRLWNAARTSRVYGAPLVKMGRCVVLWGIKCEEMGNGLHLLYILRRFLVAALLVPGWKQRHKFIASNK